MKEAAKHVQLGILFILIYLVLSSLKAVYLGSLFQNLSPVVLAVYNFILVTIFFWIATSVTRQKAYPENWRSNTPYLLALNVSTTFSWLGFYYSLKYLEPSVASALILAIGPSFCLIFGRYLRPDAPFAFLEKIAALGLFFCVFAIGYLSWTGRSALGEMSTHNLIFGLISTMLCGFGVVGNTYFSKILNEKTWTPAQIMAQRFYLLLAVGIVMWPHGQSLLPDMALFNKVLAISLVGLVIPLYSLQLGIKKCEPITVSMILALAPIVTLMVQSFDHRLYLSLPSLMAAVVVILFTFVGILPRLRTANA